MSKLLSVSEQLDIALKMMAEAQYSEYLKKVEKAEEKEE